MSTKYDAGQICGLLLVAQNILDSLIEEDGRLWNLNTKLIPDIKKAKDIVDKILDSYGEGE